MMATLLGGLCYVILSGDILCIGALSVVAGVAVAPRHRLSAGVLVWCGIVGTIVSSAPLPVGALVVLVAAAVFWEAFSRRTGAILAVAALVIAMTGYIALHRPRPKLASDISLVVVGDSLSAGLGVGEKTWPQELSEQIHVPIRNLARAGASLLDGVAQSQSVAAGRVTVLIELGGNDVLGASPSDRFAADLRTLLSAVVGKERDVFMFELPLLPFQGSYGRSQREICGELGVRLIPRSVLAGAVALSGHTTDGLHLSRKGHEWLAARLRAWGWSS